MSDNNENSSLWTMQSTYFFKRSLDVCFKYGAVSLAPDRGEPQNTIILEYIVTGFAVVKFESKKKFTKGAFVCNLFIVARNMETSSIF